jgi:transcriptional regulator with XRE-family HTH domain
MVKRPTARDVAVGQRIRALRLQRDMSQTALGERLGVTFQQVQKYEKGANRVGAGRLSEMAEALEVPVSYFFGDEHISPSAKPLLQVTDTVGAMRLFHAYDRIGDGALQTALIRLAEALATKGAKPARR